jgi:hypothetical protein
MHTRSPIFVTYSVDRCKSTRRHTPKAHELNARCCDCVSSHKQGVQFAVAARGHLPVSPDYVRLYRVPPGHRPTLRASECMQYLRTRWDRRLAALSPLPSTTTFRIMRA